MLFAAYEFSKTGSWTYNDKELKREFREYFAKNPDILENGYIENYGLDRSNLLQFSIL